MKECARCHVSQPLDQFTPNKRGTQGRHSHCRPCQNAYTREWQREHRDSARRSKRKWEGANPALIAAQKRRYYEKNREAIRARVRQRRLDNPEKVAEENRRKREHHRANGMYAYYRHGLSLADRTQLEELQEHRCAICRCLLSDAGQVHVDHCHAAGTVRGILCGSCNARLGWYENRADAIAAYLADPPMRHLTG